MSSRRPVVPRRGLNLRRIEHRKPPIPLRVKQTRSVAVELYKAEAFPPRWIDLARGTWGKRRRIFHADDDDGNGNAVVCDARTVAETHIRQA